MSSREAPHLTVGPDPAGAVPQRHKTGHAEWLPHAPFPWCSWPVGHCYRSQVVVCAWVRSGLGGWSAQAAPALAMIAAEKISRSQVVARRHRDDSFIVGSLVWCEVSAPPQTRHQGHSPSRRERRGSPTNTDHQRQFCGAPATLTTAHKSTTDQPRREFTPVIVKRQRALPRFGGNALRNTDLCLHRLLQLSSIR